MANCSKCGTTVDEGATLCDNCANKDIDAALKKGIKALEDKKKEKKGNA